MCRNLLTFLLLLLFSLFVFSQNIDTTARYYDFLIQDKPAVWMTMRQMNITYLSSTRILHRFVLSSISNQSVSHVLLACLHSVFFMPLTHEEGHRSILTTRHIGSVSQPYFNKYGAAYVKGVSDATLKNLRDNFFVEYIRLHTAGLESDYMLTKRVETLLAFELDVFNHMKWEYWTRKYGIMQYYLTGLLGMELDLPEEKNELDRDIVGHDIYGAARHLHRPDMEFYRYTNYRDLTRTERQFVRTVGWLSMLNVMNTNFIGKQNFRISEKLKVNFGLGYTMAPFGGFVDQNFWLLRNELKLHVYLRQFHNKHTWFPGGGIEVYQYPVGRRVFLTASGHFWQQPENFQFRTTQHFVGGAADIYVQYFFASPQYNRRISLDGGVLIKTRGFLPEEMYLNETISFRWGTTLYF